MRILLIWEEIPENTKFYVIDNPTPTDLEHLEGANGTVINSDENDDTDWLNNALSSPEYADDSREDSSKWHEKEITVQKLPNAGPFDRVFWSGFIL